MKILKFNDYSNIEYRKGSLKYGGLITKLMEFLRIYKDDNNELVFNIKDFEKESKIKISEIKQLLSYENRNNLINFGIEIKGEQIIFTNLTKDKSRFFESINDSIRNEYEIYGVDDFYKNIGGNYKNPHFEDIKKCLYEIEKNNNVVFSNVLDLGSGIGEVTQILKDLGYSNIVGCDPYLYNEYVDNTGLYCFKYSFSDIQKGSLDNKEFDTVIASYSLHLCDTSILPEILWRLSMISKNLVILSPNNRPVVKKENGWVLNDSFKLGKCKCRIFDSTNS
ncbi:class I SAM-dependent methyltransferase [Trichloromonas sp.]|uniref:class I SAM-dependent methyltransferase n=1 Tax=Trichloromonas sp. TaxID=3069249 RepID=UPI002A449E30|nr:class I SAM-dependent methyltransferase [Trichloromonas sp.]